MDFAQGPFAAAIDPRARPIACARRKMPGDETVDSRRSRSRKRRHARTDLHEPAQFTGAVTQKQSVEHIEAEQPWLTAFCAKEIVERVENELSKPAVLEKRRPVLGVRQLRRDSVKADQAPPGRQGGFGHGRKSWASSFWIDGEPGQNRTVPATAQACRVPPPVPAFCPPFKTGNRLNRG
jgi:hypothetical protein